MPEDVLLNVDPAPLAFASPGPISPKEERLQSMPETTEASEPLTDDLHTAGVRKAELADQIRNNSIVLSLELTKPGSRAHVDSDDIEVNADKSMLKVSKALFESKAYNKIKSFDQQIRVTIKEYYLPSKMLKGGMYRIAMDSFIEVDSMLQMKRGERQTHINAFLAEYPEAVEAAKERLGELFNAGDYLTVDELREQFSMSFGYVPMDDVPETIKKLNADIFRREQARVNRDLQNDVDAIRTGLRIEFAKMTEDAILAIKPDGLGNKKRFTKERTEKITRFIETFKSRNITNDTGLAELADRARDILNGATVEEIRDDDTARQNFVAAMEAVRTEIKLLVSEGPVRNLGDGEI